MKKNLLNILTGIFSITFVTAIAQPTITASGINPTIGQVITGVGNTIQTSPGTAGANQTWNFSSLTGTTSSSNVIAASSAPNGSSFPNANIYIGPTGGTGNFFKTSSTAFQHCGAAPNATVQVYTNLSDHLRFPFTFGNSYVDNFACTYTSNTFPVYRYGTITVSADGYGTLTTPHGTFTNVLRVKSTEITTDSTVVGSFSMVSVVTFERYAWYKENTHTSLADIATLTTVLTGAPPVVVYTTGYYTGPVGINENENFVSNLSIFPNPATNKLNLFFELTETKNLNVKVYNTLGALAKEYENELFNQGNNTTQIDLSGLPSGVYFAQIVSSEGIINGTRRFVISK